MAPGDRRVAAGGNAPARKLARVTLGGGSFWGLEAEFLRWPGVERTRVGYMGGHVAFPTHDQVATNATGHAEVVELTFDPAGSNLQKILDRFWELHDPWAVPRDGPVGQHRFRSAIFVHGPDQEQEVRTWIEARRAERSAPLMTEVRPADTLWPAAIEHQRWAENWGWRGPGFHLEHAETRPPFVPQQQGSRCPVDYDVIRRAGVAFSGLFHTDTLLAALVQDDQHLAAAFRAMRRSLAEDFTGAGPPIARYPIVVSSLNVLPGLGESWIRWAYDGGEHAFVARHRSGNYTPAAVGRYSQVTAAITAEQADIPAAALRIMRTGSAPTRAFSLPSRSDRPPATSVDRHTAGRWFEHLPPIRTTFTVGRSGREHSIVWHGGDLVLESHPSSPEHEHTLNVLAGVTCPCFRLAEVWHPDWMLQRWHEPLVASLHPVAAAPPAALFEEETGGTLDDGFLPADWERALPDRRAGLVRTTCPVRRQRSSVSHRTTKPLSSLPGGLRLRWFLGVLAAFEQEHHEGTLGHTDHVNLQLWFAELFRKAAVDSLWRWCRFEPSVSYGHIVCRLLERGRNPVAAGGLDGDIALITVAAPFRWLTHVWARGLAIVGDHLLLDVEGPADAHELTVTAVTWHQPGNSASAVLATRRTTATWDGEAWQLK